MEDKSKEFFLRRFKPSNMFKARKSKLIFIILQSIFIGMILAFPLSIEMHTIEETVLLQAFPEYAAEKHEMLMASLGLLVYPLTIILNIIFTAVISGISMLLNYSAAIRFTYKEFYSFFSFSATLPAILAAITGTAVSVAFVYLVYNFGSVLFAWLIYRRGQQSRVKEQLKEAKERERNILATLTE